MESSFCVESEYNENSPLSSVIVPIVVFLKKTFTNGRGAPFVSLIVPDTEVCAVSWKKKSENEIKSKFFLIFSEFKF